VTKIYKNTTRLAVFKKTTIKSFPQKIETYERKSTRSKSHELFRKTSESHVWEEYKAEND